MYWKIASKEVLYTTTTKCEDSCFQKVIDMFFFSWSQMFMEKFKLQKQTNNKNKKQNNKKWQQKTQNKKPPQKINNIKKIPAS